MLYFANWKIALICAICAVGVLLSVPNLFGQSLLAQIPSFLPHKQVALGLDLRGGSYLLLQVDVAAAQRERLNSIIDNVRNDRQPPITIDDGIGALRIALAATKAQATGQPVSVSDPSL